jgi:HEPN domain-containing protein
LGIAVESELSEEQRRKIEYWLDLVEYDLETAKAMQKASRYLYVGFMCQQVVEKALKACIAKTGNFPPKIHDLLRLAELAGLIEFVDEEQKQLLKKLYPLNVDSRYRSYKEAVARGLNKDICKEYIIQTEEMVKWIKEKLRQ